MTTSPVTVLCQIQHLTQLSDTMWQLQLVMPEPVPFLAGQYLLLHVPDSQGEVEQVPYSIACYRASDNGDARVIELHISSFSERAECIVCCLKTLAQVSVTLPFGDCVLTPEELASNQHQELVFIAAGSGFSQIKSLMEAVLAQAPNLPVHLYWSNKTADGFYLPKLPKAWAAAHPNLHYHAILESPQDNWDARHGLIYQVIATDFASLKHCLVFACGSPNMVYHTLDALTHLGLTQENMRSDVFSYAPRG